MSAFLQNAWYMAAWSSELADGILARQLLNSPMVFWRCQDGSVAAIDDRCPHRFAPLSRGTKLGDTIQCGYHGLIFDASGSCVRNPHGRRPQGNVRAYPCFEQDNMIWFWAGEPARANPALIPRFPLNTDVRYRFVSGHSRVAAHYELVTDNLLDLSHTAHIHPAFGGADWEAKQTLVCKGQTVHSVYVIKSFPIPAFFKAMVTPAFASQVNEWDDLRWNAPATMYLFTEFGAADADRKTALWVPSAHVLTPETAASTHYFWASGVGRESSLSDEVHRQFLVKAFEQEDMPMIEAVQKSMGGSELTSLRPILLPADRAAMRARQILSRLIAEEQGTGPASQLGVEKPSVPD
jgi:vanillate O-demethylase monooxygenase subunit